jgi:tetratricopeptide (TPR) repeat protein
MRLPLCLPLRRPLRQRLLLVLAGLGLGLGCAAADATPYLPANDEQVLAELPAGARHSELAARRLAEARLDVAAPLAQFYIGQARSTGDLRFLGYAESVLTPWLAQPQPDPTVLVLLATLQQSRHDFQGALATLERALRARPADPQAWLTRATVLRVLGRYHEAQEACGQFARWADAGVATICEQGIRALAGDLADAYASLAALSMQGMLDPERAWRDSELGEMAVRLGHDADAERWFRADLALNPHDFYVRGAYADLLLRGHRDPEVLVLLRGEDSIEPLLLRLAIAQRRLGDPDFSRSRALLRAAFAAEAQRGEPVHRREQARFLLEIEGRPREALQVALADWSVQREPDDALVLLEAARAADAMPQAAPVLQFVHAAGLRDARLVGLETYR